VCSLPLCQNACYLNHRVCLGADIHAAVNLITNMHTYAKPLHTHAQTHTHTHTHTHTLTHTHTAGALHCARSAGFRPVKKASRSPAKSSSKAQGPGLQRSGETELQRAIRASLSECGLEHARSNHASSSGEERGSQSPTQGWPTPGLIDQGGGSLVVSPDKNGGAHEHASADGRASDVTPSPLAPPQRRCTPQRLDCVKICEPDGRTCLRTHARTHARTHTHTNTHTHAARARTLTKRVRACASMGLRHVSLFLCLSVSVSVSLTDSLTLSVPRTHAPTASSRRRRCR
jgi:hypothetical protein